jgi:hypothetical protein
MQINRQELEALETGIEASTNLQANLDAIWNEPIVRRVEVDLTGWLHQLTGAADWELLDEDQDELYFNFSLRSGKKQAEVTLYHNGYAMVDLDGEFIFNGHLTVGTSDCAHLSYYRGNSGEPITVN